MKEVVVISGKGGTGKTTVLAAYAAMADDAVMADCDVDAPNLHMLLEPRVMRKEEFIGSKIASVDASMCTACGRCAELCRFQAVDVPVGGKAAVDAGLCEGCALCARVCQENAIVMRDRIVGEWYISETKHGTMVHALLEPGAENSGKLVAMVKHMARVKAKEDGASLVLVDGPPGIGCPVISALSGADLVVIVSEPTLSGLSDFVRVVDLARGFGSECALVLNKADINREVAEELMIEANRRKVHCIGQVPYDEGLVNRMARGTVEWADEGPAMVQIRRSFEALRCLL